MYVDICMGARALTYTNELLLPVPVLQPLPLIPPVPPPVPQSQCTLQWWFVCCSTFGVWVALQQLRRRHVVFGVWTVCGADAATATSLGV